MNPSAFLSPLKSEATENQQEKIRDSNSETGHQNDLFLLGPILLTHKKGGNVVVELRQFLLAFFWRH